MTSIDQRWFYVGSGNDHNVLKKNVPVAFAATRALLMSYLSSDVLSDDPGDTRLGWRTNNTRVHHPDSRRESVFRCIVRREIKHTKVKATWLALLHFVMTWANDCLFSVGLAEPRTARRAMKTAAANFIVKGNVGQVGGGREWVPG